MSTPNKYIEVYIDTYIRMASSGFTVMINEGPFSFSLPFQGAALQMVLLQQDTTGHLTCSDLIYALIVAKVY